MNGVWFKRDLRVLDQPALAAAIYSGKTLAFYVFEIDFWKQPDMNWRHYYFLKGALQSLAIQLEELRVPLHIETGEICYILKNIKEKYGLDRLYSCEETGNQWTFKRDARVKKWCQNHQIEWQQYPQNGVIRGLKNRDGWSKKWAETMSLNLIRPQKQDSQAAIIGEIPKASVLGLIESKEHKFQKGGEKEGLNVLDDFLKLRGENYSSEMSSPLTAFESCSRLSTYLSFGCLSIRNIYQKAKKRQEQLREKPKELRGKWMFSLQAFLGRLRWHCHFIQKFEDEPTIEYQALHSAYRCFDDFSYDKAYFECWKLGKTGFPLVDACMRALQATGWINFRMRAMLVSVACHHFSLPWTIVARYLSTQFTDYEPGIHYSQCQMQAGVTGMNALRIYNPIKQGYDHDPKGIFVRTWVPELRSLPDIQALEPWLYDWHLKPPIVNEKESRKKAADRIYEVRKNKASQLETKELLAKHGSRKRTNIRKNKKRA